MTKSVTLLFSSRSLGCITSQHIRSRFLRHGYPYATKAQQQPIATAFCHQGRQCSTTPEKKSDPLHILFCGSDEFSCASLKALYNEHVQNPDLIRSIDVVVRPGKRTGRGYKIVRDPPIRSLAESLGLPIHERDTFTGWNMPRTTNLIIAVSFGLFVPPRLLRAARYGGLNVHPSLLPDLRGPAPLQHTLLAGRALTGVSLQTLDPAAFDHGVVLAQTPADPAAPAALRVPPACRSVPQLQALVTPVAATMLVAGLRAGLHVPPLVDVGWRPDPAVGLVHAPKIAKRDRRLTRALLDEAPGSLARRQDAIGPLWFESRDRHGRKKRVIIEALEELAPRGVSPLGRSRMIEELPDPSTTPSSTPSLLSAAAATATASRPTAVQRDPVSGYREYAIPFEEEPEPDSPQDHTPQSSAPRLSLVFWDSEDASAAGAPDSLCLGNYRVLSLKVEGDRAKPARLALQSFYIDS